MIQLPVAVSAQNDDVFLVIDDPEGCVKIERGNPFDVTHLYVLVIPTTLTRTQQVLVPRAAKVPHFMEHDRRTLAVLLGVVTQSPLLHRRARELGSVFGTVG